MLVALRGFVPARRPAQKSLFDWKVSSGNWSWSGKYPANANSTEIVLRALMALRGLPSSQDRLVKLSGKRSSSYLVDPQISVVTPSNGTIVIETATAISLAEEMESVIVRGVLRQNAIKKIVDSGKSRTLTIGE